MSRFSEWNLLRVEESPSLCGDDMFKPEKLFICVSNTGMKFIEIRVDLRDVGVKNSRELWHCGPPRWPCALAPAASPSFLQPPSKSPGSQSTPRYGGVLEVNSK